MLLVIGAIDTAEEVTWLGVGVAILVAAAAALWKLAGLRGDISDRWSARVEIARAGISERAAQALRTLRLSTDQLLGTVEEFNPLAVIEDPTVLRGAVKDVLRLFRFLDRLPNRYRRLLRLGPILMVLVALFSVSVALLFSYLSDLVDWPWAPRIGAIGLGASGVGLITSFVFYSHLQHYLSKAETESREFVPDGGV